MSSMYIPQSDHKWADEEDEEGFTFDTCKKPSGWYTSATGSDWAEEDDDDSFDPEPFKTSLEQSPQTPSPADAQQSAVITPDDSGADQVAPFTIDYSDPDNHVPYPQKRSEAWYNSSQPAYVELSHIDGYVDAEYRVNYTTNWREVKLQTGANMRHTMMMKASPLREVMTWNSTEEVDFIEVTEFAPSASPNGSVFEGWSWASSISEVEDCDEGAEEVGRPWASLTLTFADSKKHDSFTAESGISSPDAKSAISDVSSGVVKNGYKPVNLDYPARPGEWMKEIPDKSLPNQLTDTPEPGESSPEVSYFDDFSDGDDDNVMFASDSASGDEDCQSESLAVVAEDSCFTESGASSPEASEHNDIAESSDEDAVVSSTSVTEDDDCEAAVINGAAMEDDCIAAEFFDTVVASQLADCSTTLSATPCAAPDLKYILEPTKNSIVWNTVATGLFALSTVPWGRIAIAAAGMAVDVATFIATR